MILITFDYSTSYAHYFHMVFYDFSMFLQIYKVYLNLCLGRIINFNKIWVKSPYYNRAARKDKSVTLCRKKKFGMQNNWKGIIKDFDEKLDHFYSCLYESSIFAYWWVPYCNMHYNWYSSFTTSILYTF